MFGLKKQRSRSFRRSIEAEFRTDLEHIRKIASIPLEGRIPGQELFLEAMREKYPTGEECPSYRFNRVSKEVQEEYLRVHKEICSLLYPNQSL